MIKMPMAVALISVGLVVPTLLMAQQVPLSPYAGQETRSIKSLSTDDIAELQRGGGWGMAKAAELNGLPGPVHLLELQARISMSTDQLSAIKSIFAVMKSQAITAGEKYIALERQLDDDFKGKTATDRTLRSTLTDIAAARQALRYIHLSAHLRTRSILSVAQIEKYNALRGYGGDACGVVPEGHDAQQWRRHNNCR